MTSTGLRAPSFPDRNTVIRRILYVFLVLLMSNLGAMVDLVLHPEIRYFEEEHLIVGGITALAMILLLGVLESYLARRKQIEGMLQRSEERHRAIFDRAGDGIFTLSPDGKLMDVNESFARMHGYSAGELLQMNIRDLDTPGTAQLIPERMRQLLAGEILAFEVEHYHKDGHVFPLEVTANLVSIGGESCIQCFHRDITERKRAEEAMMVHLAFREGIVECAAEGICVCHDTPEYPYVKFTVWNSRMTEITGYTMDEINRLGWYQAVYPDPEVQGRAKDRMERMRQGSNLKGEDWEITRSDGTKRVITISTSILHGSGGTVHVLGLFHDLTDRRRAEDARKESEERYHELFENANDIIFTIDLTGKFTAINKAAEKITGYTLDDALKMNISSVIAPEFVDVARQMLSRKDIGGGRTRYELEIECKDGNRAAIEFSPRIIYRDGKPVGIQGIARDTTERKRAEEALRESEERFRGLSEASLEGIMVHDQGVILDANRAFAQLFGYGYPEELIGKNGPDLLLTPESRSRIRQRIQRQGEGRIELTGVRKDGTTFAMETESRPMKYRGRDARIVSFQDLTDRKRDEEEKVKLQGQLQQAMKMEAIGRLAGGVAHDFNNILTVITGYCDLLLRRVGKGSPICGELEEIKRAGDRAALMTQQLLAFSRKQIIEPKVMRLDRLVAEVLAMLARLIGEDISLQATTGKSPGSVKVDPGQFQQILMNLVVNARDAMPGGGKIVIETANVDLDGDYCALHPYVTPGRFVMLSVSDTGQGMGEEVKAHIFEPFFTTKERGSGTGLGLATTYGAVKQSGGSIEVYSEVGKGTTFKIYLPRVEEEEKPVKDARMVDLPGGTETVLLVEDEDTVRNLGVRILRDLGYRVTEARSGAEAVAAAEGCADRIDLLLTDVVMPGMSGKELATQLVLHHPEAKVLFMSGYTDNSIVHHGVLDEGVSFIGKPYTPSALARKVREVLDKA